jgi:hypothetical protein
MYYTCIKDYPIIGSPPSLKWKQNVFKVYYLIYQNSFEKKAIWKYFHLMKTFKKRESLTKTNSGYQVLQDKS